MSPHIAVLSAASAAFPSTQAGQGTGDGSWAQEAVSHLASVCVCVVECSGKDREMLFAPCRWKWSLVRLPEAGSGLVSTLPCLQQVSSTQDPMRTRV